jgi:hypothetical protein
MYLAEGPNHTLVSKGLMERAFILVVVHKIMGIEGANACNLLLLE